MVPFGSKALFGMAGVILMTSFFYGVVTNETSATTILGFVAIGAFALGVVVVFADPDHAPWVAPDAPLTEQSPVGARRSLPSPWPLVGALALGGLAVGAATNAVVVTAASLVAVAAGLGWLYQHWSEHPTYTARYAARLKERFLGPIALPVGVAALVGVIAISLSRVFLALPEQGTRVLALAIAVVIIVSAFAIAASERMARTALALLSVFTLICVVGAGVAGLVNGERKFEPSTKAITHHPLAPGVNPAVAAVENHTAPSTTSTTATSVVGSTP